MTRRTEDGRTPRCPLRWSYLLWLACASPDLGHTLFSCATDGDCAPGQVCAAFQGGLACQRTTVESANSCPNGDCGTPGPRVAGEELQPWADLDAPRALGETCRGACLRPNESLPSGAHGPELLPPAVPLTDAGSSVAGGALDASPGAARDGGSGGDASAPDAGPYVPSIRFDFESSREGWQSVRNQLPEDTLDGTEQSTVLAHHGAGALRMVFDGAYTPTPGVSADSNAFYGAFVTGAPPPGARVSLWMLSTAPDVSIEVYAQTSPAYDWVTLAFVPLQPDQWREITLTMPVVECLQFGVQVHAPLALKGFVYLDELRW